MLNYRGLRARGLLVALALGLAPGAEAADAGEMALKQDQAIQALKNEVLGFAAEAQAIETDVLLPPHARASIYLSVKVSGLLLEEASVTIDDRPPEVYHYDGNDARALLNERSAQRLTRLLVSPGAHRIRVTFSGHYADDKKDAPPVTDTYEAIFDKDAREAVLEFTIARERRFSSRPRLSLKQWTPAS